MMLFGEFRSNFCSCAKQLYYWVECFIGVTFRQTRCLQSSKSSRRLYLICTRIEPFIWRHHAHIKKKALESSLMNPYNPFLSQQFLCNKWFDKFGFWCDSHGDFHLSHLPTSQRQWSKSFVWPCWDSALGEAFQLLMVRYDVSEQKTKMSILWIASPVTQQLCRISRIVFVTQIPCLCVSSFGVNLRLHSYIVCNLKFFLVRPF